ncbi:MAG: cache domain-containing protein, partial [Desulfitobacteriaceae bacterium]
MAYWEAGTGRRLATQPFGVTTLATARSQPWFEQSLGQQGVVIDRLSAEGNGTGEGMLFAVAVRGQRGQNLGVLSAAFSESDLRQQLEQTVSLPAHSRVWLVNQNQHFVLEPRSFPGEPERYDPAFLQQLEQTHVVSMRSLKTTGWQLIVAQDKGTVFADAGQLSREIVLITSGILLMALLLALWYIRSFLKPMQQVMGEIRALSEGYSVED